jgi:hypothetical protein
MQLKHLEDRLREVIRQKEVPTAYYKVIMVLNRLQGKGSKVSDVSVLAEFHCRTKTTKLICWHFVES